MILSGLGRGISSPTAFAEVAGLFNVRQAWWIPHVPKRLGQPEAWLRPAVLGLKRFDLLNQESLAPTILCIALPFTCVIGTISSYVAIMYHLVNSKRKLVKVQSRRPSNKTVYESQSRRPSNKTSYESQNQTSPSHGDVEQTSTAVNAVSSSFSLEIDLCQKFSLLAMTTFTMDVPLAFWTFYEGCTGQRLPPFFIAIAITLVQIQPLVDGE